MSTKVIIERLESQRQQNQVWGYTECAADIGAGIDELKRLRDIVADIEEIRSIEANSVEILCDDPDADDVEKQAAVDVDCDFTGWEPTRFYGRTWTEALSKAAAASRAFNGREKAEP